MLNGVGRDDMQAHEHDQGQDLAERVARLDVMAQFLRARDLAQEVGAIRAAADAGGILPVAAVARALERAVARGESRLAVGNWISILNEAVGCGRTDAASGHVLLAAGAVRLAG
jgi:hypothetical protein